MGKGFVLVLFILLLSLISLGTVCIVPVKAQGTPFPTISITINADGTITQQGTYFRQTRDIYTLNAGIYGQIIGQITVLRNNAVIDGDGNIVQGIISVGYTANQPLNSPIADLSTVSNVTVENFNVTEEFQGSPGFGIEVIGASNVTIANNNIEGVGISIVSPPQGAINVEGGGTNRIVGNNLFNNSLGIVLWQTENNLVTSNNITDTNVPRWYDLGLPGQAITLLTGASNNNIFHNNFVDNDVQVYDPAPFSVNVWDNGYPFGGNYWSDYQTKYPNATEVRSSGIDDTPYVIDQNNTDRYPLMQSFTFATYILQTTPPKVSVLSPLNQTFDNSTVSLVFFQQIKRLTGQATVLMGNKALP